MAAKVYTDADADLGALQNKTLAVIGFGSQGHAHALNLRDSGFKVLVGLYPESKSVQVARDMGFEVANVADVVKRADVMLVALPDLKQKAVYESEIRPNLRPGKTLIFIHGFSIHFKQIEAPADVHVIMVAPKGPGHIVRAQYTEGKGVPALIAIHGDNSAAARPLALAWAKGIGSTRAGVIETTFREETETDLFGEQAVLCGGATALVLAGYETLVEAGYQPEMAYFECLHELKLIVDLMIESGLAGMRFSISDTAEYGDYTRGPRVIGPEAKAAMRQILKEIQSGEFAREWIGEAAKGYPNFQRYRQETEALPIEKVGAHLRSLMPWLRRRNVKGAQAAYSAS